jgi:hypothetical protein
MCTYMTPMWDMRYWSGVNDKGNVQPYSPIWLQPLAPWAFEKDLLWPQKPRLRLQRKEDARRSNSEAVVIIMPGAIIQNDQLNFCDLKSWWEWPFQWLWLNWHVYPMDRFRDCLYSSPSYMSDNYLASAWGRGAKCLSGSRSAKRAMYIQKIHAQ